MKVAANSPFRHLAGHRYMSLTTFRKDGTPVPTPVWFAQEGDHLYVVTGAESGKVKRIRRNAQVEVAPCTVRGELLGESAEAMARILPEEDAPHADALLNRKYSWQKWAFDLVGRLRGDRRVWLEIMPM
ncbi:MAG: PPOX class F420-dependent oxidoreductase [Aggregatilineales bacterium]